MTQDPPDPLTPYVPRIAARWLDEHAAARHQLVSGSLVSADLSGFTALSERLATQGRAGAEEVVSVVNGCFEEMIAVAVGYGGDILKFGGDALLMLFDGDEHAERAAVACAEIRRVVSVPRQSRTAGPVELGISIGLHSGDIDLFLGRGLHAELIVTGPGATETIACESEAESGQILVSASAADVLPPDWLEPPQESGRRRANPPMDRGDLQVILPPPTTEHLSVLVPRSLLKHLEEGSQQGEIRPVTTAFIAFSGMDEAITQAGPRRVARSLESLVDVVSQACEAYNIHWLDTDIAADGGKIHLTAGAPTATSDDDGAMLHAVRAILDTCPDPPLAAGVNHGMVFVGDVGSPARQTIAAMGDSVNLAARLCGRAQPGQLIASLEVIEGSATTFEAEPIEPFLVKGKSRPILAGLVGSPMKVASGQPVTELPLVARDEELGQLRAALNEAVLGVPQLILLHGPGGIGKTRLAAELHRVAEGVRIVRATCDPYQASAPFVPFRSLLQQVAGIDADADPRTAGGQLLEHVREHAPELLPWTPLLALPLDAEVPPTPEAEKIAPAFRRIRLQQAITDFLREALTTPTIIILEDIEWLDNASKDLLGDLLLGMFDRPWCLILTGTSIEDTDTDSTTLRLDLPGLDDDALRKLAIHALGDFVVRPHELERLVETAAGHPLFLLELIADVRANGAIGTLPRTIESAVTSRLDSLAPADLALLRQVAVLGAEVSLSLVGEILGTEATDVPRWEPMSAFVEVSIDVLRFREPLYQQVAYDGIAHAVRTEVHARAADALSRNQPESLAEFAAVARHEHRAGRHERAWHASVAAANAMREQWAIVPSVEHFERALLIAEHLPDLPGRDISEVAEFLGDVAEIASLHDRAVDAFVRSFELAVDEIQKARLLDKMAESRRNMGDHEAAEQCIVDGLETLSGLDGPRVELERGRLAIEYARLRFRQGRLGDVRHWTDRALDHLNAADDVPPEMLAQREFVAASGLMQENDPRAEAGLQRALESYGKTDDLIGRGMCHTNLGVLHYYAGDWNRALEHYQAASDIYSDAGYVLGSAITAFNFGEVCSNQNRHAEAVLWFEDARRRYRASHNRLGVAASLSCLGWAQSRVGAVDQGEEVSWQAIASLDEIGAGDHAMSARLRLAEILVDRARSNEADELLAEVFAAEPPAPILTSAWRIRGLVAKTRDRQEEAIAAFAEGFTTAQVEHLPYEAALAARALADLGGSTEDLTTEQLGQLATETFTRLGVVEG